MPLVTHFRLAAFVVAAICLAGSPARGQPPAAQALERWLDHVETTLPARGVDYYSHDIAVLDEGADAIERWAAAWFGEPLSDDAPYDGQSLAAVVTAKNRVDDWLDRTLALRTEFASHEPNAARDDAVRNYLRTTSRLITLSAKMRYLLLDALRDAAYKGPRTTVQREQLIELMESSHGSFTAAVLAPLLRTEDDERAALGDEAKGKLLDMIADSGEITLLSLAADLIRDEQLSPKLVLQAAQTIRELGLTQNPRPGQSDDLPTPPITAAELYDLVARVDPSRFDAADARTHAELLGWLDTRRREGIVDDVFRLGGVDLKPGDWLLMRNPSPYNRFTNLAPGLFTHVGVVALERGADGLRRMVLVDLPERGSEMPATNVEIYVLRSLHYVFVRHQDPEVGRRMGEIAATTIGAPTEFDLKFEIDAVESLRGQPLGALKIKTYCAGLPALCAQEAGRAREEFFPLRETVAGGATAANLARLGISIGDQFVSPTGALFSPQLEIVARRQPMYEPEREIRETIYDHFADSLKAKTLVPSPDAAQILRIQLAEMARENPLLASALARSQGVSAEMDLVSAAKTAAVVETLDEIAYGASDAFFYARDALLAGPLEELAEEGYTAEEIKDVQRLRQQHGELLRQWRGGEMTPRRLRQELVEYYAADGKRQLEERFFSGDGEAASQDAGPVKEDR